jgi:metal-dependent amidase/aminoacylase/carboxypeptidase family protein
MDLAAIVRKYSPELSPWEALYKDIHRHPELSQHESRTARLIARMQLHFPSSFSWPTCSCEGNLPEIGYEIIGLFSNGPGPTVLLQAELDAPPIKEQSGLPCQSTKYMKDSWGRRQPVIHAHGVLDGGGKAPTRCALGVE